MIIRPHRKNEPLWPRLSRTTTPASHANPVAPIADETAFLFELARETSRSNRRSVNREFALIVLHLNEPGPGEEEVRAFVSDIQSRLRISDTLGWYQGQLAVLLPETERQGAMQVANDLAKTKQAEVLDE